MAEAKENDSNDLLRDKIEKTLKAETERLRDEKGLKTLATHGVDTFTEEGKFFTKKIKPVPKDAPSILITSLLLAVKNQLEQDVKNVPSFKPKSLCPNKEHFVLHSIITFLDITIKLIGGHPDAINDLISKHVFNRKAVAVLLKDYYATGEYYSYEEDLIPAINKFSKGKKENKDLFVPEIYGDATLKAALYLEFMFKTLNEEIMPGIQQLNNTVKIDKKSKKLEKAVAKHKVELFIRKKRQKRLTHEQIQEKHADEINKLKNWTFKTFLSQQLNFMSTIQEKSRDNINAYLNHTADKKEEELKQEERSTDPKNLQVGVIPPYKPSNRYRRKKRRRKKIQGGRKT